MYKVPTQGLCLVHEDFVSGFSNSIFIYLSRYYKKNALQKLKKSVKMTPIFINTMIQNTACFLKTVPSASMPWKKQLFVQSHSVIFCTRNRVLFFEENWNLKVKAVLWDRRTVFTKRMYSKGTFFMKLAVIKE